MPRGFIIKVLREKSRCEMLRVQKVLEKRLWTVCRPCMVEESLR